MTTTNKAQLDAMTKAGFTPAQTKVRRRLIVSIEGDEKTGKNNFAFTAPDPIAVFSFDDGLEGVIEKFANGTAVVGGVAIPNKTILVKDVRVAPTLTGGSKSVNVSIADPAFDYKGTWETFVRDYHTLLAAKVRTIIWDTGTEVYELLRLFRFGKLSEVPANMWGPVKAEYRQLIRDAYDSHTNLIILHRMKPVYLNDKRTGAMEISGFSDVGYAVQVNLKTFREDSAEGSDFSVKVLSCRQNGQLNGVLYEGMMCTFPWLAVDVLEDSDLSEWE